MSLRHVSGATSIFTSLKAIASLRTRMHLVQPTMFYRTGNERKHHSGGILSCDTRRSPQMARLSKRAQTISLELSAKSYSTCKTMSLRSRRTTIPVNSNPLRAARRAFLEADGIERVSWLRRTGSERMAHKICNFHLPSSNTVTWDTLRICAAQSLFIPVITSRNGHANQGIGETVSERLVPIPILECRVIEVAPQRQRELSGVQEANPKITGCCFPILLLNFEASHLFSLVASKDAFPWRDR